jgi:hypothetical protein
MSTNFVLNARIVANNEYVFQYSLAPTVTLPDEAAGNRLAPARIDRVLPLGSSAIAAGMSVFFTP